MKPQEPTELEEPSEQTKATCTSTKDEAFSAGQKAVKGMTNKHQHSSVADSAAKIKKRLG